MGVTDLPYSHTENIGKVKKGKNAGKPYASTTGDVAEILEDYYHIMEVFWELYAEQFMETLEEAAQGAFETLMMGGGAQDNAFAAATSEIEERFLRFISEKEMDKLGVPGVPTAASLKGVNTRFKKRLDPGRPSFKDTGLYMNSFRCWVE